MGRPIFFTEPTKKKGLNIDPVEIEKSEQSSEPINREKARHNAEAIKAEFEEMITDYIQANKARIWQQIIDGGIAPEAIPQFLEGIVHRTKEKMFDEFFAELKQRVREKEERQQQPPPRSANM